MPHLARLHPHFQDTGCKNQLAIVAEQLCAEPLDTNDKFLGSPDYHPYLQDLLNESDITDEGGLRTQRGTYSRSACSASFQEVFQSQIDAIVHVLFRSERRSLVPFLLEISRFFFQFVPIHLATAWIPDSDLFDLPLNDALTIVLNFLPARDEVQAQELSEDLADAKSVLSELHFVDGAFVVIARITDKRDRLA